MLKNITVLLICSFLLTGIQVSQSADGDTVSTGTKEVKRPGYQNLRFNENWKVLKDLENEDLFDPIKYIPLSDDGEVYLSIGGQVRERLEMWSDFGFKDGKANRDSFFLTRLRLHADLHLGPYVRVFVEAKSAHSSDRDLPGGRRGLDTDNLDIQNAFLDIILPFNDNAKLTLRGGRQELSLGKQRLVSPLDWANTRRTFDGGSAILQFGDWSLTGFYVDPVIVEHNSRNKDSDHIDLYGTYLSGKLNDSAKMDLYWIGLENRTDKTYNGTTGEERRHTFGSHLFGKLGESGFDYDVEGAWQTGKVGEADINAWMFASQVGYRFADVKTTPRTYLGFDYSSGDNAAGGDVETFNHLFPLAHAYHGFADVLGRQNVTSVSTGVDFKPTKKLTCKIDYHHFWRSSDDDALYNAGGAAFRSGAAGSSTTVGDEIDLTAVFKLDKHTKIVGGYSHFFASDFIRESGPDQDIDFGYLAIEYTF